MALVGSTFLVAYLVEKSLSIDNLVVMMMIFRSVSPQPLPSPDTMCSSFKIRPSAQPRVLKWGIFGAIVMRVLLILAGVTLLQQFNFVLWLFGAVLLYAAYKMFTESDQSPQEEGTYLDSKLIQLLKCVVAYDDSYKGNEFLHSNHQGKRAATPMLAALLVIEASDLVFAIDSIPCVLGITDDLFIAYTSNLLAILGLRYSGCW